MIYNGNINDTTDFKSEKAFYVNSCGTTHTCSEFSVIREFGRNDYHILYVIKGNCYIEKESSIITLEENDIFKNILLTVKRMFPIGFILAVMKWKIF